MTYKFLNLFFILTLISFAYAETNWIGEAQPAEVTIEVLSHCNAYTEVQFNIPGFFTRLEANGQIMFSSDDATYSEIPQITRLIAIPAYKNVRLEILSAEFEDIDLNYIPPSTEGLVQIGEPVIMRDVRVAPLTIFPLQSGNFPGCIELLRRVVIRVNYEGYSPVNNKVFTGATSSAFRELYQSSILNYEWLDNGNSVETKGTYLIITPSYYSNVYGNVPAFDQFVQWKKMKGYQVETYIMQVGDTTCSAIYNIIQSYFQSADPALEYVLLVGDVNGGVVTIPAFPVTNQTTGETDPSDHPYSLLVGTDYFSDILVGRISVSYGNEAQVVYSKILKYEKTPYMGNTTWYKKMLSVGGNYNDSGPAPITPCQTSWWMADYFLAHGFTAADTVLYWGPDDPTPGSPLEILGFINSGRSFVTYRGWADANGWQYPSFTNAWITPQYLINGLMMPVFGSFVCNTGNFGSDINPCFGENLLRFGTPINGGGAVAFYGPSDLNTNTNYNNAVSSGFCEGLWEADQHHLATAAAYSKMTLYEAYPNIRNTGGDVWFYFHVYNCLGDPELDMWRDIPLTQNLSVPASLSIGGSDLTAHVSSSGMNLSNAYVTVLAGNELAAGGYTDASGDVTLTFAPLSAGSVFITATKYGYIPHIDTVSVISNTYIGYLSDSLFNESNPDGALNPGETATLKVTIKNYGSTAVNNISGTLSTNNPYISLSSSSVSYGNLTAGASASGNFNLTVEDNAPTCAAIFNLSLTSSSGNFSSKFTSDINSSNLVISEVSYDTIYSGEQGDIIITLFNSGDFTASNIQATLYSFDEAVSIVDGQTVFGDILPGQTASNGTDLLRVQIAAGTYENRNIQMRLDIFPEIGALVTRTFDLVVGDPDSTDPTGPDPYGYFAYDDGDVNYTPHPTYNWVELDPNYPGHIAGATRLYMEDDESTIIEAPFDIVFYGDTYDHITICTNGWISFTETWMSDFRNWDLPSPLGPPTLVAGFWDDLKDTSDGVLDIYYWTDPAGRFIVEWSRVDNRFPDLINRIETFEIIVYDPAVQSGPTGDCDILFQYFEVNDVDYDNNFSTVGIEDYWHHRGLEYIYAKDYESHPTAHTLHNQMAVKITTTPPDNYSGVENHPGVIPDRYSLAQNFPNPFNQETVIQFELAKSGMTILEIYDINGRKIKTLIFDELNAGKYSVRWNGTDSGGKPISSGIYFVQLQSGDYRQSIKIVLLK